jgi:putative phosphoesterase
MKIGIISDTHRKINKAKKALDMLLDNGVEFIIHAGDIVEVEILDMLESCGIDYVAVYGNNDNHLIKHHTRYKLVKEPHYFELADLKFKLMHLPYYMAPDSDIVIFGHTHMFKSEFINNTLFINPGEVCARKKPLSECAMLEVLDNEYIVTYYSRVRKSHYFIEKELIYPRSLSD